MNLSNKKDGDTTPLYPFKYVDTKTGKLEWYTSAKTHNVEDFNYTYPELEGVQSLSLDARRKKMVPVIDKLYPQVADDIADSFLKKPEAGARMLPQAFTLQVSSETRKKSVTPECLTGLKPTKARRSQTDLREQIDFFQNTC